MIEKCSFGIGDKSDHSPVIMTLALSKDTKTTLWKRNVNVLKEKLGKS